MDFDKLLNFIVELLTTWGLKLLCALALLAIGIKLTGTFTKWLKKTPNLDKLDAGLRSFLVSFLRIVLYVVLIITVAMILGIPATSFITILASCGVAIGLALQGALSNFAGGLMILFFKPFEIGDYIEVADVSGTVKSISVVYTSLITPDNKRITLPNGSITNAVIKNYSAEPLRRVDFTFSAAYDCDTQKVKEILTSIVENHSMVLKSPEPFVRLSEHADSALIYTVRVWSKSEDYWTVYFDVIESVKTEFDKNNISIPFPQMDVHITK